MRLKAYTLVKSIAATATPEALSATELFVDKAILQCPFGNTNNIFIGDASVDATSARGIELNQGDTLVLEGGASGHRSDKIDLSTIYVDVLANGDDCSVLYFIRE